MPALHVECHVGASPVASHVQRIARFPGTRQLFRQRVPAGANELVARRGRTRASSRARIKNPVGAPPSVLPGAFARKLLKLLITGRNAGAAGIKALGAYFSAFNKFARERGPLNLEPQPSPHLISVAVFLIFFARRPRRLPGDGIR